jgi:hypothetical protein
MIRVSNEKVVCERWNCLTISISTISPVTIRVTLLAERLFGVRVAADVCYDGSADDSSLGWDRQLCGVMVSVSLTLRAALQVGQRACDAVSPASRENHTRPHTAVEVLHLTGRTGSRVGPGPPGEPSSLANHLLQGRRWRHRFLRRSQCGDLAGCPGWREAASPPR